jgi:hypothetical protein
MYPSILSFETNNKLKLFFECGIPRPQDTRTPSSFGTYGVSVVPGVLEIWLCETTSGLLEHRVVGYDSVKKN